jgi:glycerol kinase
MTAPRYIAALDQGTTSTRCALVDHAGQIVALARREHRQIFPRPGWVEHDPLEIWQNTQEVIRQALLQAQATAGDIAAIGITNQRETTVLWLRSTGKPIAPAIVWQDTRTDALVRELAQWGGPDRFRSQTGLPLATYFSGPKIRWLLDALPQYRHAAEQGELLFGTMGHLVDLAAQRRTETRLPCYRCDQRQPNPAFQSAHAGVG